MIQYYFAYGSNMNLKQLLKRCPEAQFLEPACLKNWQFVYDGFSPVRLSPVANIIKKKDQIVWGGLYEISQTDLKSLDQFEGYPVRYNRQEMTVSNKNDQEFKIWVYRHTKKEKSGQPTEEYRALVIKGAYDCHLPLEYIKNTLTYP